MFDIWFVLYLIYEYFNFIDYSECDASNKHIGILILEITAITSHRTCFHTQVYSGPTSNHNKYLLDILIMY